MVDESVYGSQMLVSVAGAGVKLKRKCVDANPSVVATSSGETLFLSTTEDNSGLCCEVNRATGKKHYAPRVHRPMAMTSNLLSPLERDTSQLVFSCNQLTSGRFPQIN